MRNRVLAMVVALAVVATLCSCQGERCKMPFGEGATLDLTLPDFMPLLDNPGATLVVNRGYKGILVHCIDLREYVAFECACPNCVDVRMQPDDAQHATLLECPQCGSRYELYFGNPLDGASSSCPLYQYATDCRGQYLIVY